jgi:hypothetical protein
LRRGKREKRRGREGMGKRKGVRGATQRRERRGM